MAGRGGRGAALLQALEKPTRPPGQTQNGQNGRGQPPNMQQQPPYQQQPPVPQQQYQQSPQQRPPTPQQQYQQQYQQPGPQQQYQQPPQQYQQPGPQQQYQQGPYQQPPRQPYQQPPQQQYRQPAPQQPYQRPQQQPYQQPQQQMPYQQPAQQPARPSYQPPQQQQYRQPAPQQQQYQQPTRPQSQQPPYQQQQQQSPRQPYQQPQQQSPRQPYQQPPQQQGYGQQQPYQGQRPQGPRGPPQSTPSYDRGAHQQGAPPPQGVPSPSRGPAPPPQGAPSRGPAPSPQGAPIRGPAPSPQGPPIRGPAPSPQGAPIRGPAPPPQGPRQPPPQQSGPQSTQPPSPAAPSEAMSRMSVTEQEYTQTGERGTSGKSVPLSANYIPIHSPNQGVFQYCVSFSPETDSKDARIRMVNQHKEFLKTKAFDGVTLYLPRKLDQEVTDMMSEHPYDASQVAVTITLTRIVPPDDCLQLYNILLRRIMRILKMKQVGRYYYDPSRPAVIPQHNIELWPGYITAIQHYQGGLMLLCDISHRLIRTDTCLNFMVDMYSKFKERFQDETTKQLVGTIVLTRYNNKTYRIDDIEWNKNPLNTFTSHSGEETTYVDYYKKAYGIEIKDHHQPLLVHRPKRKDNEKDRRGRPSLEIICLIPELCCMTGLTDSIRQDFRVMKDISSHTRVGPMQRLDAMKKFIQNINSTPEALEQLANWGLQIDQTALQTEGRQYAPEQIRFQNTSVSAGNEADWGRDAVRNKVISAVDLHSWIVMFVKRDQSKAFEYVNMMKQVTPVMGINVKDPEMIEIRDDRTETYLRSIRENLHPRVQMVVVIFPTSRDDRYAAVKKLCCVESPVPSQVINARTISQANKLRSVTQKIALQINVKLGGTLWGVDIPSKSLMVVGIDVYHDAARGGRSVGGMVCSVNQSLTRWHSRVCFQSPGQELMDGLKMALTASLKKFHEINNSLPQRIVVFRDGVGDGQLKTVAEYEVEQLSECFALFGETYVPKMTVIVVQKRINTRLFLSEGRGPQSRLTNPGPGTVLDHTITRKDWYDFFLVSQHVRQGTVTPTHYVVIHDTSKWKPDIIQKLAYKLTHLYYNWPGTVSVPAPCQYAHKLAFLVGQSVHAEPSHDLSDRLFFL